MKLEPGKLYQLKKQTRFLLVDPYLKSLTNLLEDGGIARDIPSGSILMFLGQVKSRQSFPINSSDEHDFFLHIYLSPNGERVCVQTFTYDEDPELILTRPIEER